MATKAQYEAAAEVLAQLDAVAGTEGTIQAEGMLQLTRQGVIRNDPTYHTTTSYDRAAALAGLEQDEDGEWYAARAPAWVEDAATDDDEWYAQPTPAAR